MHVGFISQWFDPETGAAAVPGVQARALSDAGHHVTVLTGFPNYPYGTVYPGYRMRPVAKESRGRLDVVRVPSLINHSSRAVERAGSYLSFAASSTMAALTTLPRVDACWVHMTPATVATAAWALARFKGIPYVAHVQDLWPDTVTASGFVDESRARRLEKSLGQMCSTFYSAAAAVAVTSPGMIGKLVERGVPATKVTYLPNWADESAFHVVKDRDSAKSALGIEGRFVVMYAGNFGEFQALETLIEAARRLAHRADIQFVLVGAGVEEPKLRALVSRHGLRNVTFLPSQSFDRMAQVLAAGDVQVISLRDRPLSRITLPSKLQATLAAGRPIIGVLAGDPADVVREAGSIVVDPGSPDMLAGAIRRTADMSAGQLDELGDQARLHYETHYSEGVASGLMQNLLDSAVRSKR